MKRLASGPLLRSAALWCAAASAGTAVLLAAQSSPAQGGAPAAAPAIDNTPSDAAATGFLQSVVDARVYSLESVGVARIAARIHATFDITDPLAKQPSTTLDLDLGCDYATGAITLKPTAPPTPAQQAILPLAASSAQNALLPNPSRNAAGWRVAFAQDGEEYRLDYVPRNPTGNNLESYSEWHRPDGTPLRRRVKSRVPGGGVLTSVTQELVLDYEEVDRRLLLKELKPVESHGSQFSYRFEYAEQDGLRVLKKLVQENQGWRLTLDFTTKLERAAPAAKK